GYSPPACKFFSQRTGITLADHATGFVYIEESRMINPHRQLKIISDRWREWGEQPSTDAKNGAIANQDRTDQAFERIQHAFKAQKDARSAPNRLRLRGQNWPRYAGDTAHPCVRKVPHHSFQAT